MRLYFDTCCLCRPFDDRSQDRIAREADAVMGIFDLYDREHWTWISSTLILEEVGRVRDRDLRDALLSWSLKADEIVFPDFEEVRRAEYLASLGFGRADALHIACAEKAHAEILLTTDERLLRLAMRERSKLQVAIANPIDWFKRIRRVFP